MSKHLQKDLEKLKTMVLSLSLSVEESVARSVESVKTRDTVIANEVINGDHFIDMKEVEIEEECLKILALYQPLAIDLRYVVSILKINNDLERVGDLAVNTAKRSLYLSQKDPIDIPFDFATMEIKTRKMLSKSLDSLFQMNVGLAKQVFLSDDEVDEINKKMYSQVTDCIKKDPKYVKLFIQYLSISRNLERIADYATNIAEDVIYLVEGEIIRHRLFIE